MKLGIFAKTFDGHDQDSVLNQVRNAGYDCVQYNWACAGIASMPDDVPPGVLSGARDALLQHELSAVALSGTFNMIHPDAAARELGLKQLGVVISSAVALNIPMVTLCTGTRNAQDQWAAHPDNNLPDAWSDMMSIMERAVAMAERAGICLGVEPELANTINSVDKAKRLMREFDTPHLRIVLDPANLFEVVDDDERRAIIASAIDQLAPYISLCHAKDRQGNGEFCTAGDGVIDYPHYLACLAAIGFDGALITHGLPISDAPRVARFLSSLIERSA